MIDIVDKIQSPDIKVLLTSGGDHRMADSASIDLLCKMLLEFID